MHKKRVCNLKVILIFYNLLQVTINAVMLFSLVDSGILGDYKSHCMHFTMELAELCWYYFMSKFVDLLDTIFLVLDKRYDQVSSFNVFYDGYTLLSGMTWNRKQYLNQPSNTFDFSLDRGKNAAGW